MSMGHIMVYININVFLVKLIKISMVDQNRNMHVLYKKIFKVELHPSIECILHSSNY